MTTSTTDAEAIARLVSPDSWKIRDRHVAGANDDPGLTETERANALASAECYVQESLKRANRILSYLASRREAQEPIHQYRRRGCSDWYDGHPDRSDGKDYETRVVYLGPPEPQEPVAWRYRTSINGRFGKWTVQKNKPHWFEDGMTGVELEPLYTAPPAPAGEPTTITYTNYRGETAQRTIIPKSIWFGSTEWHPEPQWLLRATDVEKNAERDFALKDFGTAPAGEVERLRSIINETAYALAHWQDQYHDCDCPAHESCGCKELRGIRLTLDYFDFTGDDARTALDGGQSE